ncbi:acetyl-CoA synthetase-like protein [Atractiella rhizophila]|nr:acetyl-CoA synthetase-like protein [Atractiella rhizophila]
MLKEWGRQVGLKMLGFDEVSPVEALGAANPFPHIPPKPEDMVSICYTSGTTGTPKGAILTHASITSVVLGNLHGGIITAEDVALSFLPLSRIYEQFIEEFTMYWAKPLLLFPAQSSLDILGPTVLVGMPRILNQLYQAVKFQTLEAPGVKGKLLNHIIDKKIHNLLRSAPDISMTVGNNGTLCGALEAGGN